MDIYLPGNLEGEVYSILESSFLGINRTDGNLEDVTYTGASGHKTQQELYGVPAGVTEVDVRRLIEKVAKSEGFSYRDEPMTLFMMGDTFRLMGVIGETPEETMLTIRFRNTN